MVIIIEPELQSNPTLVQVAALPWRLTAERQLRLLLITSRHTKKWMLPKGWKMEGKADHETAMIEAFEEAGVQGAASSNSIGSYTYLKVQSDGTAQPAEAIIFPLRVERLSKNWRERQQRDRQWLSVAKAAKAVFEPDLQRFLRSLSASHLTEPP